MGVGESEAIGAISPSDSGRETARGTAHCAHICLRHCIRLARHAASLQVYVLLSTVMAWTQTLQDFDATCRVVELDCVLTTGQWQDQRREGHHTPNARGRWMWDGAEPLIYAENPTRPPLPGLYPVFYSGPTSPLKTVCEGNCPIVQASLASGETKKGLSSFEILGTLKKLTKAGFDAAAGSWCCQFNSIGIVWAFKEELDIKYREITLWKGKTKFEYFATFFFATFMLGEDLDSWTSGCFQVGIKRENLQHVLRCMRSGFNIVDFDVWASQTNKTISQMATMIDFPKMLRDMFQSS